MSSLILWTHFLRTWDLVRRRTIFYTSLCCSSIHAQVHILYTFLYIQLTVTKIEPSRLILHLSTPSQLTSLLIQPSMSSALIQMTAYPTVLLTYLATAYLTLPPPASPSAKFWGTFLPFSERSYEIDRLVFGVGGEGAGRNGEMVVEVLVRGGTNGSGKVRGVERTLEGWMGAGPCGLTDLESLKSLWVRKAIEEVRHRSIGLCILTPAAFDSLHQIRRGICLSISISLPRSSSLEPRSHYLTRTKVSCTANPTSHAIC
jgi:hypothetical protein